MSTTRKIAHNTLIQMIGKITSTILGLFSIGVLTRYLKDTGFGEYTSILAFLQLIGIFSDLGLSLVVVQMISEQPEQENKIINNIFTFRFVTALIVFAIAPVLAMFLPYSTPVKIGIAITTIAFFSMSLNQLVVGIFQKKLEMFTVTLSENISRILLLIFIIIATINNGGLVSIMVAVTMGSVINFFMNTYFTRKWLKISLCYDKEIWKKIWKKSWPIGLSIFFNLIYFKADTFLMSMYRNSSETGIYGASYKVLEVLITFPFMFLGLMVPFFTQAWQKKDQSFAIVAQKAFDTMAIFAIPIIFGGFMLGTPIMTIIAGQKFAISGDILKILVLAVASIFLSNVFTHIVVAIDKQKILMFGFMATAVVGLSGYVIFIPIYSYWAAAWVTVISETMVLIISAIVVYRATHFFPQLKKIFIAIISSVIMAIVIYGMTLININILLIIPLSTLIYFVMLYLLKGISREIIQEIIRAKNTFKSIN